MLKYRLSLFLFTFLIIQSSALIIQSSAQLRDRISLSGEWQFFKGDTEISSQVEHVTVPHSWNAQDGTTADYYRGKGTYRYNFDLPKNTKKNVYSLDSKRSAKKRMYS